MKRILLAALVTLAISGCANYGYQHTTINDPISGLVVDHITGPKRLTESLEIKPDEECRIPVVTIKTKQVESQAASVFGGALQWLFGFGG